MAGVTWRERSHLRLSRDRTSVGSRSSTWGAHTGKRHCVSTRSRGPRIKRFMTTTATSSRQGDL